jgi:hypothetical protein
MESEAARAPDAIAPEASAEVELAPTQSIETFPTEAVVMLPHLESAANEEPTRLESLLLANRYWWRVLEIFLVLLALVSGLLAVYLHRVATP